MSGMYFTSLDDAIERVGEAADTAETIAAFLRDQFDRLDEHSGLSRIIAVQTDLKSEREAMVKAIATYDDRLQELLNKATDEYAELAVFTLTGLTPEETRKAAYDSLNWQVDAAILCTKCGKNPRQILRDCAGDWGDQTLGPTCAECAKAESEQQVDEAAARTVEELGTGA